MEKSVVIVAKASIMYQKAKIRLLSFVFVFILFCSGIEGQTPYATAVNLMQKGSYAEADSLFSLVINTSATADAFFNRAITKLNRMDSVGFCRDMLNAQNLFLDSGAIEIYVEYCCERTERNFYNKRLVKTDSVSYKYSELIEYSKYDLGIYGIYYADKLETKIQSIGLKAGWENYGITSVETNIVGIYSLLDSKKYFIQLNKKPWTSNKMQYDYFKSNAQLVLKGKYGHLKNSDESKKLKLFYSIKVNDMGEIVDANFVSMDSENGFKGLEKDLDAEIKTFIKHYPDLYPGQLLNNKVNSLIGDYIEF